MIEPADFRLVQLHLAPGLGIILGRFLNQFDDAVAIREGQPLELFLSLGGGGDGRIDSAKDALAGKAGGLG